jgi:hypothetical protein
MIGRAGKGPRHHIWVGTWQRIDRPTHSLPHYLQVAGRRQAPRKNRLAVCRGYPSLPKVAYVPESNFQAGLPTYGVMGLFFRPEDEFSHGLNERVQVDAFFGALEYWHDMLTDLAGN